MGDGKDDRTIIEITCCDSSCNVQICSDPLAFGETFMVKTRKSELIARIICHDIRQLLVMDRQALMERRLGLLKNDRPNGMSNASPIEG